MWFRFVWIINVVFIFPCTQIAAAAATTAIALLANGETIVSYHSWFMVEKASSEIDIYSWCKLVWNGKNHLHTFFSFVPFILSRSFLSSILLPFLVVSFCSIWHFFLTISLALAPQISYLIMFSFRIATFKRRRHCFSPMYERMESCGRVYLRCPSPTSWHCRFSRIFIRNVHYFVTFIFLAIFTRLFIFPHPKSIHTTHRCMASLLQSHGNTFSINNDTSIHAPICS